MKTKTELIPMARRKGGKLGLCLVAYAGAAGLFPSAASAACGPDLTTQFEVHTGALRKSAPSTQTITARNAGSPVKGPIYLEIYGTPNGVWQQNYTFTSNCSPGSTFTRFYLGYSNTWNTNVTLSLTLKFANLNNVPITYSFRIVKGDLIGSPHMTMGDFDGDRVADLAVFDPPTALWTIKLSASNLTTSMVVGTPNTDRFVIGDFDGDLKEDMAVFTPATATWTIRRSSDGVTTTTVFGAPNLDVPIPADYDGDGYTDLAVYRPTLRVFTVLRSTDGKIVSKQYGGPGSIPVPADWDGDGRAEYAFYDPANTMFHMYNTTTNQENTYSVQGFSGYPFAMIMNNEGHPSPSTYDPNSGIVTILDLTANTVYSKWIGPNAKVVAGDFSGDATGDVATYDLATAHWAMQSQMANPQPTPVASFGFGTPGSSVPVLAIPSMLKFPQLLPW